MLIRNPRIWLAIWAVVIAVVVYGGVTNGWTPLRVIVGLLLLSSGILRWLGWYFTEGILLRLDRMDEAQRESFLARLKPNEREALLKRLEQRQDRRPT